METRRLGYFVRIAEDGSLSRAAGVLNVAHSALSRHMRLLEEELGITLFARSARGMRLTSEGAQLRAAIAGPLRELELAIQNIRALPSQIEGNVAIGLTPGIADLIARTLSEELFAAFPKVRFRLSEGPTGSLEDWLGRAMIDVAVLEQPSTSDQLESQPLVEIPFRLLGPKAESSLNDLSRLRIAEVFDLPLIVPSHHMGMRPAIDDAAMRARARPNIVFEANCPRLIKDLVQSGMGYALLPEAYIDFDNTALGSWSINDPLFRLNICLSTRKDSRIIEGKRIKIDAAIAHILNRKVANSTTAGSGDTAPWEHPHA